MAASEDSPHINTSELSFFNGFRATFYLLSPAESSFKTMGEVPNYVTAAIPHFFIMIILEMAILYFKGRELRLNDKLTSVGAGMYSEVLGLMGMKTMQFAMYANVYKNYCIYELPWDSPWTWITMALLYDFIYYWFHRAAHEVSFLWNTHQTHHSSEDYALPTALRQSATQTYASSFFYLPAALLIPPSIFIVHSELNLLYQFWIHTELVDSLGPLEYILNTPSHHRVHHGRNPHCIDKNYAAVLIIWDRMFGTFQPEKKDEKVVYGLVHPINTFDSNSIQVSHYIDFVKRFWQTEGFTNKIKFIFCGPGWSPGTPRLGNPEDIPKIEYPVKVYNPEVSNWLTAYVLSHFLLAVGVFNLAVFNQMNLPSAGILSASIFILASLTCFGYLFDKRSFGYATEFLRCALCTSILLRFRPTISLYLGLDETILFAFLVVFAMSTTVWALFGVGVQPAKKKTN